MQKKTLFCLEKSKGKKVFIGIWIFLMFLAETYKYEKIIIKSLQTVSSFLKIAFTWLEIKSWKQHAPTQAIDPIPKANTTIAPVTI